MLTSSLLTDRMLRTTVVLRRLAEGAEVRVFAASVPADNSSGGNWPSDIDGCTVRAFPPVSPVPFLPLGLLHELADTAWEARHRPVSRVDRARDGFPAESRQRLARVGAMLGRLGASKALEATARAAAIRRSVPEEVEADVSAWTPDLTLVMNPFHSFETGLAAAVRRRGSRVIALIPSWDNLTTKRRLVFPYDGFLVWSEEQAASLRRLYPQTFALPVHVVGTPQYDAFTDPRLEEDRTTWCARHGLDVDRPIVLYALGSPNLFDEVFAVKTLVQAEGAGAFGDAQLLIRPHPIHGTEQLAQLSRLGPSLRVQRSAARRTTVVRERTHDLGELIDWVNTFRHADVVVNLSSTSTVDAAVFDHPVVNLDYDPAPGGRRTRLVKEVNRRWEHFAPVAQSDGVELVGSAEDLVAGVQRALTDRANGRAGRAWIVDFVCGPVDGKAGDRFAAALLTHLPDRLEPVAAPNLPTVGR